MKGAIRDPDAYVDAALRRQTERFDACFPRGITFGDLDSFVEIGGRFLIIEWKLGAQTIPNGQEYALSKLAAVPGFAVWAVWTSDDGTITHVRDMAGRERVSCDLESLQATIERWAHCADLGVAWPDD